MVFGPILIGAATAFDSFATQQGIAQLARGGHTGSPRLSPGSIGAAAAQIQKLSRMGLQPVVTSDLNTGNLVVATRDQDIARLVGERNLRVMSTPSPADLRDAGFIAAVERARNPPTPSPGLVLAPIAAVSHDVVGRPAPGQVVRGMGATSTRGGPCAGAESAFQRIRCNLGGLA